jgi:hypothetical protein
MKTETEDVRSCIMRTKDKIEDLELLIYGIDMRIYYDSGDHIPHLKKKKQEKIKELENLKAFLSNIVGSK